MGGLIISVLVAALAFACDAILLIPASRSPEKLVQHPGKCLKFIHIPRTGGTIMDSLNLNLPIDKRAYHSLMEQAMDRVAGSPSFPNITAGKLFDVSHGSELQDKSGIVAMDFYGEHYFQKFNYTFYEWQVPEKFGGFTQRCQDLHTPPQYSPQTSEFFSEDGCTNFCVVRDPMRRILSAFKVNGGVCSLVEFNDWILYTFPLKKEIPLCHAYPQVQYVYNALTPEASTKTWCHRILQFENLHQEYNALMEDFGKPLRMNNDTQRFWEGTQCKIDPSALSAEAKDRIYKYYQVDYDAFGYPPP